MQKLKLPVESLEVETFDAGEAEEQERGTVEAHMKCTRIETTCNPDVTTVMTGSCHNCRA